MITITATEARSIANEVAQKLADKMIVAIQSQIEQVVKEGDNTMEFSHLNLSKELVTSKVCNYCYRAKYNVHLSKRDWKSGNTTITISW